MNLDPIVLEKIKKRKLRWTDGESCHPTIFWKGEQRWRLEVGRYKMAFDVFISMLKTSATDLMSSCRCDEVNLLQSGRLQVYCDSCNVYLMCLSPSDGFLFRDVVYDCINIKCLLSLLVYNLFGKCSYELLLENKVDLLGKQYLRTKASRGRHCFENNYNDIMCISGDSQMYIFFSIIGFSKPDKHRFLSLASCRHQVSSCFVRTKSTDKITRYLWSGLNPMGSYCAHGVILWLDWLSESDHLMESSIIRDLGIYIQQVLKYFAPNKAFILAPVDV